jgi:phytanoyl-CoA hydroxylase
VKRESFWLLAQRLLQKLRQRRAVPGYRSRFGGLWTDRLDALQILGREAHSGRLDPAQVQALTTWITDGYWIAPAAVDPAAIERLADDVEALWTARDGSAVVEIDGQYLPLSAELRAERCKLVDLYARSPAALELALSPAILSFLRLVFAEQPLLFQSLSFERGSEQPIHQDTAYVVVTPPLHFAATWIALEDIAPGSGELAYYPGSQNLPDTVFRGGVRHWNRARDGLEAQRRYHDQLLATLEQHGLERRLLRPRRGDVLFWSADLAHGGSPIRDPALTRKSLVCHYCPRSARPYYFGYRPGRRIVRAAHGAHYASSHYDLSPR